MHSVIRCKGVFKREPERPSVVIPAPATGWRSNTDYGTAACMRQGTGRVARLDQVSLFVS